MYDIVAKNHHDEWVHATLQVCKKVFSLKYLFLFIVLFSSQVDSICFHEVPGLFWA